ncbi:hypothetical protein N0V85_005096 [Neurospora sp. IMI 360204]|nr:hypothetical protein N0V85_005096 [Neurospora sp. IMI 360204]
MTQYPQQQQYGWVQHPHGLIAGITSPTIPPGQAGLIMYDAFGMSRGGLPAQTQGHVRVHVHAQGLLQGQRWPCLYVHPNQGHTNPVYLSHPQQSEKDFLAQYYARLSLADTGAVADKKSPPIPATTAPSSTVTVPTPEAPTAQQQSQIVTETTTGTGTGTGATGLTITTVTGTSTSTTRTITGPDGTVLVPPSPIPAHPGCELSPQMAKAMEDYAIEHCCDYMQAKNLLRDKIVAKILENTQEKLMELLQNELDRMSSEEEEDDYDDDLDLDSDMEEEGDWTTMEG